MGQKVHPNGYRVGISRAWNSCWMAPKGKRGDWLVEDMKIRDFIKNQYGYKDKNNQVVPLGRVGQIPKILIERRSDRIEVVVYTGKPGVVIGRKGDRVDEMQGLLRALTKNEHLELRVEEVKDPETIAQLVAEDVAQQIVRRQAFRRVIKRTLENVTKGRGIEGAKVQLSGRLGGAEMRRCEHQTVGKLPLSTLRANIDYGFAEARCTYGIIGVKVWLYKGKVPSRKEKRAENNE